MGSFAKKVEEETRRVNEDVFGKVWKEKNRAEDKISSMFGGSRGQKGDVAREIEATRIEARRIGPRPTALTGGLQDAIRRDKKRKQFGVMTGGLGELNLNKPSTLGR